MTTAQRFDSLADMFNAIKACPKAMVPAGDDTRFFQRGTEDAMRYVLDGATSDEQADTMALLNKIDAGIQRERREYVGGVAGAFVNVPEYLMGQPMHMRRRMHVEADVAPVRVVIETLVSAGVTQAQLARRGAAVSALVMRLGEIRPVELWAAWGMKPTNQDTVVGRVRIDTAPLNVGRLCAVMNSASFCRSLTFAACGAALDHDVYAHSISWAWRGVPTNASHNNAMREALDLNDADVYIPGGHLNESDMMMKDPVKWVNKYLESQRDLT